MISNIKTMLFIQDFGARFVPVDFSELAGQLCWIFVVQRAVRLSANFCPLTKGTFPFGLGNGPLENFKI